MRHEHQRLLFRVAPARRLRHQPLDPRIGGVHREGLRAQCRFVGTKLRGERRAGRQRPPHAIDLVALGDDVGGGVLRTPVSTSICGLAFAVAASSIGMPTRGGKPPMSARRVALVHAGSGVPCGEARLDAHVLRKILRPQQLQQSKEPVRVVFERRGAEQQHVTAQARDGRDRAPRRVARDVPADVADAAPHRPPAGRCRPRTACVGQLRPLDQHLDRDHGAAMQLERVEVVAEIARHIGEAIRVEEREHLVILPPQLAQPLHRQGVGRHHQAARHFAHVDEPVQDERRLDGFSEAHFVGEQPADRIGGAGALGDVELVREEPDAAAEKRSQAVGLTQREQVQDVHPRHEVVHIVEVAHGEPLEQRAFELQRPQRMRRHRSAVHQRERAVRTWRGDGRFFVGGGDADRASRRRDRPGPAPRHSRRIAAWCCARGNSTTRTGPRSR